jgi:hypothetical protein
MRNHGVKPVSDPTILDFESIGTVQIKRRSPDDRKKEIDNILNWIRSGKPHDEDSCEIYCKIDQMLRATKGQTPRDRARNIESALDWMRNTGVAPDVDDDYTPANRNENFIPVHQRSPEQRARDLFNIVT